MSDLRYSSLYTGDLVLRNLASRVTQRLPRPVRLDRIRFPFPYETDLKNLSKRKKRKRNGGYERLRRRLGKRRRG